MSFAVYQETEKDIDLAYKQKNAIKIEKETSYILSQLIMILQGVFIDRLNSITFDMNDMQFDKAFITSEKNRKALLEWLNRMVSLDYPIGDYEFGKLKVDLEEWYYQIGGEKIQFNYHKSYLITPSEAAEQLGISKVTLNKYVKQGLEYYDNGSHNRIPKHVIPLWKDPKYAIKIQWLYQKKKIETQSPEERLKEIYDEVLEFQKKYKTTSYQELTKRIQEQEIEDIADYYEWENLEEERKLLLQKIIGKYEFE